MIGPFIQIVKQILETLVGFGGAIEKSRGKKTKRILLRLFFDIIDFEDIASCFLLDAKNAISNRNRNSLRSAVSGLRALHAKLDIIIDRFYSIARSDAGRYFLEMEGDRVGRTLVSAFGADQLLLLEWSQVLGYFVANISRFVDALPEHWDTSITLPALDERDFSLGYTGILIFEGNPEKRVVLLSELITETEQWLRSFAETTGRYRALVKSQVSLQDIL